MLIQIADEYLARCVSACIQGTGLPPWRSEVTAAEEKVFAQRVLFHGIALLLTEHQAGPAGWPASLTDKIREEARLQTFWEASHHAAIASLLDALHARGIAGALIKGTALAYSLYDNSAVRRRGDSDLLVPSHARAEVRDVFERCGFVPLEQQGGLQEGWQSAGRDGFVHEVDLHWRINSSPAIAHALEQIRPTEDWISLPRLSPHAKSLKPVHNLILACLNRTSHRTFGYYVENAKLEDSDRLIWACDIHLLCQQFCPVAWGELAMMAHRSDTADIVHSGLEFARRSLGTPIPAAILEKLAQDTGQKSVHHYLVSVVRTFGAARGVN